MFPAPSWKFPLGDGPLEILFLFGGEGAWYTKIHYSCMGNMAFCHAAKKNTTSAKTFLMVHLNVLGR